MFDISHNNLNAIKKQTESTKAPAQLSSAKCTYLHPARGICASLIMICSISVAGLAHGHGDVTPQGLDTDGLPEISNDVLSNPFRKDAEHGDYHELAAELGKKGYAGNCANCHGIEAMSGGLTPDLRELTEWDDEYYISRVVNGTGGGMPSFKENLDRTAVWAIKTYVESVQ